MEETQINITQTIMNAINGLFESVFSSIDNNVYDLLDDLAFINNDIFNDSFFEKIFGTSSTNGLLLIANSLLVAFALYYCIKLFYSTYLCSQVENPYQFVFKLLLFGAVMNSSYFIVEQIVSINSLVSSSICGVGKDVFNIEVSFSSLIQSLNSIISINQSTFNIFSFDGLIKGFVSISLFNLVFSYSLRYVMLKVFLLITPFSFLSLLNQSTAWFFKTWFKALFSLLITQSLIALILLIAFSIQASSSNLFSKILYIGTIYALIRANSYVRQLIGGISTDVSNNLNLVSSIIK